MDQILHEFPQICAICLDVANGYSEYFVEYVKDVRQRHPDHIIMAGNVVTGEMVEQLILCGADVIKVGIGPGMVHKYFKGRNLHELKKRKIFGIDFCELAKNWKFFRE